MTEHTDPGRDELHGLAEEVHGLATAVDRLARLPGTVRRSRIALWIAAVLIVALAYFGWRTAVTQDCLNGWANATTSRTNTLSGPSTRRVDYVLKFLTDGSAGATFTAAQRAQVIQILDRVQHMYPKIIPAHDKLIKTSDTLLAEMIDVVRGLQANDKYQQLLEQHPIPAAPSASCNYWI